MKYFQKFSPECPFKVFRKEVGKLVTCDSVIATKFFKPFGANSPVYCSQQYILCHTNYIFFRI